MTPAPNVRKILTKSKPKGKISDNSLTETKAVVWPNRHMLAKFEESRAKIDKTSSRNGQMSRPRRQQYPSSGKSLLLKTTSPGPAARGGGSARRKADAKARQGW